MLEKRHSTFKVKRLSSLTMCLDSNPSSAKDLAMLALGKSLNLAKTQLTERDLVTVLTTKGGNKD